MEHYYGFPFILLLLRQFSEKIYFLTLSQDIFFNPKMPANIKLWIFFDKHYTLLHILGVTWQTVSASQRITLINGANFLRASTFYSLKNNVSPDSSKLSENYFRTITFLFWPFYLSGGGWARQNPKKWHTISKTSLPIHFILQVVSCNKQSSEITYL